MFTTTQRRMLETGGVILALVFSAFLWQYRKGTGVITSVRDSVLIRSTASGRDIDRAFAAIEAHDLVGLGSTFKQAERRTGINALFLAAIAVHESDKGTSDIARMKNNLFGWGAYDSNPFGNAYSFPTREAGILHVSSRLKALYVDDWKLETIDEISNRYASDPQWGSKVFSWVWRLQNEIYY